MLEAAIISINGIGETEAILPVRAKEKKTDGRVSKRGGRDALRIA